MDTSFIHLEVTTMGDPEICLVSYMHCCMDDARPLKIYAKTICNCIMALMKDMPTTPVSIMISNVQCHTQFFLSSKFRNNWGLN